MLKTHKPIEKYQSTMNLNQKRINLEKIIKECSKIKKDITNKVKSIEKKSESQKNM